MFQFGDDILLDDQDSFGNFMQHSPMGTSTKAVEHVMQWFQNHEMRYFDYGNTRNLIEYGFEEPPNISLQDSVGIPKIIINGKYDNVADYESANQIFIENNLGPIVFNGTYDYGHYSYFASVDMSYLADVNSAIQNYVPQRHL